MKKHRNAHALVIGFGVLLAVVAVVVALAPSADSPCVQTNAEAPATSDSNNSRQHVENKDESGKEEQKDAEAPLNESVLAQFEVADSAASDATQSAPERKTFSMPEDASYEGGVALFTVDPTASAEQVSAAIASVSGIVARPITERDLAMGLVKVELAEGVAVEDAVNELLTQGIVKTAQPNYVYYADDLLENEEPTDADQSIVIRDSDAASSEGDQGTTNNDAARAVQDEPTKNSIVAQEEESELAALTDETQTIEGVEEETAGEAMQPSDAADGPSIEAEAVRTPNDTYYVNGNQWGLDSIKAPSAWGELPNGASGVTVAVLDMGFNVGHKDLSENMLPGYNSEADTTDTSVAPLYVKQDSSSWRHGTHVSGIIAAITNNSLGVAGAANNYVKVLPIMMAYWKEDVLKTVATSESFQRAFRYVINVASSRNVRVINLSVGTDDAGLETWVEDYVQQAYNMGIVTVTSSGNLNASHKTAYAHYPSDLGKCVAVMSMAENETKSDSSNYNMSITDNKNICAPGVGIYSTALNNDYTKLSGASMATAFASSAVALEFVANPNLTAGQAIEILYGTSKDLGAAGWDLSTGYGEVDAYAAVVAAKRGGLTSGQRARLDEHAREAEGGQGQQEQQYDTAAANSLRYRTHVQSLGWQDWKSNGATSGTSGESKRLEAIQIKLEGAPYSGGIQYRTHVQSLGWQDWKSNGATSGTSGESKRLEAIEIKLTGEMANHYSVWYRVHAQTYGWLGWTRDGGRSGTATLGKRLEGIQIRILPKTASAPGSITRPYVTRQVCYRTHVQSLGWQSWVYDGELSGTSGQSKRLEGINIKLPDALYTGGIRYRTHVQSLGWQSWVYDGELSGTSGQSKRLEAIRIELYGEMANRYDVWYRVHAQTYGWLGWTSNGGDAGTAGLSRRLEAIEVQVLPKGSAAPGSTSNAFVQG